MKIFPLERLINTELDNKDVITTEEIAESLYLELQNKYLNDLEVFGHYLEIINSLISNKKRKETIIKKFDSKIRRNEKQKIDFKLLSEITQNLTVDECRETILLVKELHYKAVKMCLALEDNNSEEKKKKDLFEKNQLELTILLNRMGKFDEAENVINLQFSKVYTYSSYIKKWKKDKKTLLKKNPLIRNTMIDELLSFVENNVKKQLSEKQKKNIKLYEIGKSENKSKKFENIGYLINICSLKNITENP